MERSTISRGFSLVELVAVIAVVASVTAVLGPTLGHVRGQMRGVSSEGNLAAIGQASGMYGMDNGGRIFTYSWRGGESYLNIRSGKMISPTSDIQAAAFQARDILWRTTDRITGPGRIFAPTNRLMQRRFAHLVLADYMGGNVSDSMWADPADGQLLGWQQDPFGYINDPSSIPYGEDYPVGDEFETGLGWDDLAVRQFWAYGSSYQQSASVYLFDDRATYGPTFDTPHLYISGPALGNSLVAQRNFNEVAFPSAKVFMFEEFDREQAGLPYFMYDFAAPAKLMFDGSINTAATGLATLGVDPRFELHNREDNEPSMYEQRYVALDKFPLPLDNGEFPLLQRYHWTSGGLKGLDYPQVLMGGRGR